MIVALLLLILLVLLFGAARVGHALGVVFSLAVALMIILLATINWALVGGVVLGGGAILLVIFVLWRWSVHDRQWAQLLAGDWGGGPVADADREALRRVFDSGGLAAAIEAHVTPGQPARPATRPTFQAPAIRTYPVGIVGESHYQRAIAACRVGEAVRLTPEPSNAFDARAVAVKCERGQTIGYLPRDSWLTEVVLDHEGDAFATIKLIGDAGPHLGVVLDVAVKDDAGEARGAYQRERWQR